MSGRPRPCVARAGGAVRIALAALLAVAAGCGPRGPEPAAEASDLDALRAEVRRLRDSLETRLEGDSLVRTVRADRGHVTVAISVPLVTRLLHAATRTYLDDVRIHLEPDVVVREGDEGKVKVGPIGITAGRWNVQVTVERIEAHLHADTVELTVADTNRIDVAVPVEVREGSGRARIEFAWDASTAASVVCRDFRVRDTFHGTVAPHTYRLEAALVLEAEGERVVARPRYTGRKLSVRPEPTPESWRRVREILDRQNNIFRCGLAISPDELEALLRKLLREGFRFDFPESILQPVPLPTAVHESLEVEGRSFVVGIHPVTLRLGSDRLWYSVDVELLDADREAGEAGGGEDPPDPGQGSPEDPGSSTPM